MFPVSWSEHSLCAVTDQDGGLKRDEPDRGERGSQRQVIVQRVEEYARVFAVDC